MNRKTPFLLAGLALVLAACEPSETDMRQAVETQLRSENQGFNQLLGRITGGQAPDLSFTLQGFKKIACKEAGEKPGYVCDYSLTAKGPLGEESTTETGRFVKGDAGWTLVD